MSLLKLTNASFEIEFDGKPYTVRKASLEQVVKFMQRTEEYKKADVPMSQQWIKLTSYALSLVLTPLDPSLTEDFIASNIPGDCNAIEVLTTLGFINPARITPNPMPKSTTEPSSPISPTEPDGLPAK